MDGSASIVRCSPFTVNVIANAESSYRLIRQTIIPRLLFNDTAAAAERNAVQHSKKTANQVLRGGPDRSRKKTTVSIQAAIIASPVTEAMGLNPECAFHSDSRIRSLDTKWPLNE